MANFLPVVTALFITIYQQTDVPAIIKWLIVPDVSDVSNVVSRMLILMSSFLLILDNQLMPDRYRTRIPRICALIIDYLVAQIAMASLVYVWTQFQSMLCVLLKELLLLENDPKHSIYHELGGDIFLGYFTTSMSLMTLWYSFKATGSKELFKRAFFTCIDGIVDISLKICDCSDDENEVSNVAQKK